MTGTTWAIELNRHFLQHYEPYIVKDWKNEYLAYDSLKHQYKLMKANSCYDIEGFESRIYYEIKRVHHFMKATAQQIDQDLTKLEESIAKDQQANDSSSKKDKGSNSNKSNNNSDDDESEKKKKKKAKEDTTQQERNITISLRALYQKIERLEKFYHLNFYCIVKTTKKFDKLISSENKRRKEASCINEEGEHDDGDDQHHSSTSGHGNKGAIKLTLKEKLVAGLDIATLNPMIHLSNQYHQILGGGFGHKHINQDAESIPLDQLKCWKDLPSGRYFHDRFSTSATSIRDLKQRCISIYSGKFRPTYSEVAEYELLYVKNKDHSTEDTNFYIGLKFGLIICMIFWLVFDSNTSNKDQFDFWQQPGLFIYTMIGNLLLYRLLWAFKIYVWSKLDINYIPILQLTNEKPNLLLVANQTATLLVFYFVTLIVFCRANTEDSVLYNTYLSYGCPFILLIVSILYQIYEYIFLFGNEKVSRGLFGTKVFYNMAFAPFTKLRFRDIYVADVLTSFNRVIADTLYSSCWIISGSFSTSMNADGSPATSTSFGTEFIQCTNNIDMIHVVSFMQLMPLITRALQCFRGIYDSNFNPYPQGYNAIKYLLSIAVVIVALYQQNIAFYYSFIVIVTLYKWWWDVVMDWGLCDRLPRTISELIDLKSYYDKKMFLRENLMYPSITFYYIAIVVDLGLRFLWVLSLLPPSTLGGLVGYQLSFFLGSMEIARRSMWGIIRVEWEHLKMLRQNTPGFLFNEVLRKKKDGTYEISTHTDDGIVIGPMKGVAGNGADNDGELVVRGGSAKKKFPALEFGSDSEGMELPKRSFAKGAVYDDLMGAGDLGKSFKADEENQVYNPIATFS